MKRWAGEFFAHSFAMARPLRLQFPGGHYHVMSRGNDRRLVFLDDVDRQRFLLVLDRVCTRLDWRMFAYCLMNNHYHLFFETPGPSLAAGMRDLNGWYAQYFNRRHEHIGHVFQARYTSKVVDTADYFLKVVRYIALNPVKAGLCATPGEWLWSSHRASIGQSPRPGWFCGDRVLGMLGSAEAYEAFLLDGLNEVELSGELPNAAILGSARFIAKILDDLPVIPAESNRNARICRSLSTYLYEAGDRNLAIRRAYASGGFSMTELSRYFDLHISTISKICRRPLSSSEKR